MAAQQLLVDERRCLGLLPTDILSETASDVHTMQETPFNECWSDQNPGIELDLHTTITLSYALPKQ